MPKPSRLVVLVALIAATVPAVCGVCGELPVWLPDANAPRSAIPGVYKWDLAPLFASDQAFEQARVKLLADVPRLAGYVGKLGDPAALAACLDLYFRLHRDANFLTLYANLR